MENSIMNQLYSFFIYIISGIIIGLFFDIFRILRRSFKTKDLITYIEDITFWIVTGIFLLFILFTFSNGQIRIYNIFGLFLGGVFYMLSISKYFIKINVIIVSFIKNIIYKVFKFITYPLKFIYRITSRIFKPFTFFVININKILFKNRTKQKNINKSKKLSTERRIFRKNVEKYN